MCLFCLTAITGNIQRLWRDSVTLLADLIITLDADLQNRQKKSPAWWQKPMKGYDVVGTVRQNRQDSWFRKTASKMINQDSAHHRQAMGDYGCMLLSIAVRPLQCDVALP